MTEILEKCCGNCKHFELNEEFKDYRTPKPGYCICPLPYFARRAVIIYQIGTLTWENRGKDCDCFKAKERE